METKVNGTYDQPPNLASNSLSQERSAQAAAAKTPTPTDSPKPEPAKPAAVETKPAEAIPVGGFSCTKCKSANPASAKFCQDCGNPRPADAAPTAAASPAVAAAKDSPAGGTGSSSSGLSWQQRLAERKRMF